MPAPETPLLIVNPIAGSGRAHGIVPRIEAWLAEQGIEARLLETREKGHAERLAAAATDLGHDRVIAVGGDGTIQEVLNGLLAAGVGTDGGPPAMGIVPAGRGNDLARSVDLPIDPVACLPIALGPTTRPFDVGRARSTDGAERYFGAAGGVGFDAEVAYTMAVHRRFWMRGEAGYFLGTLNELRRYRNRRLEVTLIGDGEDRVVRQTFLFVAFANGPYYGGGMQICPDAETDDGWLDVCLVGDLSRLEALRELPGIYQAKHVNNRRVEIVHARSLRIEGDAATRVHLDGEPFGNVPVEVSLLPAAVSVAVAPRAEAVVAA
ncbi:MAG TPA: diacylglycerol kinase family protein [Candidatus Limnocylindria bacterium]|nr:diacylglycerol kinase family protein [Candidatus Limnocylindria bacterium]